MSLAALPLTAILRLSGRRDTRRACLKFQLLLWDIQMTRRANDDLLVLTKTSDLLLWYTTHISRFPRHVAIRPRLRLSP